MKHSVSRISKFTCIELSECILNFICSKGIQQKEIANSLGIDPSNLSRLLNGRYCYGIDSFIAICNYLGIEIILKSVL